MLKSRKNVNDTLRFVLKRKYRVQRQNKKIYIEQEFTPFLELNHRKRSKKCCSVDLKWSLAENGSVRLTMVIFRTLPPSLVY
jgi:hypothetical protein